MMVPRAFAAGYGMYDPQLDIVLSPRRSVAGKVSTSHEGSLPTIAPDLIDHFVGAMKVDDSSSSKPATRSTYKPRASISTPSPLNTEQDLQTNISIPKC